MEEKIFGRTKKEYIEKQCIYTVEEIFSQPEMWRETMAILKNREKEIADFMERCMSEDDLRIIMCGAGSSAFIGETMQYMLGRELDIGIECVHTTDIVSAPQSVLFDVPTLMISYGRSGESPESSAAVRLANQMVKKIFHIIIVCDGESTLAECGKNKENCLVFAMPEKTCDRGFAMTSSVSCMSIATWCMFHYKEMELYEKYIDNLAECLQNEFELLADKAKRIARFDYRRLVWLGTGALKGLAREGSIKSMELSDGYVFAGYDAPMGFRHGPKTVVNNETMTIHMISPVKYSKLYDIDFLEEMVREKGENMIVSVGTRKELEKEYGEDEQVIYQLPDCIPEDSEMPSYLMDLVFVQLLSMEKSLSLGYSTDNPSQKGDVNRVVKGVIIHEF